MDEDSFWTLPLGAWIRDCVSGEDAVVRESSWRSISSQSLPLQYIELCDAIALFKLYTYIEPRVEEETLPEGGELAEDLLRRRFVFLLQHINSFYRFRLNRVIVMSLPDVISILRNPTPDGSGHEMNKLLLLLLGCAVQSDERAAFVSRITQMDPPVQAALVTEIQKITEGSSCVVAMSAICVEGAMAEQLLPILTSTDSATLPSSSSTSSSYETAELVHEQTESDGGSTTGASSLSGDLPRRAGRPRSPSPSSERHLSVEHASLRAQIRRLRNELDEKEEMLQDSQEKLRCKEDEALHLQDKCLAVLRDAQEARHLRDEVDCLNQKIERLEKCERDALSLRRRVSELEDYKTRSKQLERENDELEKSVQELQVTVEMNSVRAKGQNEAESRIAEAEKNNSELQANVIQKNKELERLLMEVGRLERELNEQSAKAAEWERAAGERMTPRESLGNSLLEEMEESSRSEMAELKMENKRLKMRLEGVKEEAEEEEMKSWRRRAEEAEKAAEESREEHALTVEQLHALEKTLSTLSQQYKTAKQSSEELRAERDSSTKSLQEARRNFSQFQTEFGRKMEDENRQKIREVERQYTELSWQLETAKEEKKEQETMLDRARKEGREAREDREKLLDEKRQAESMAESSGRARKTLEAERNALREKLAAMEDELEEVRVKIIESGDWKKRAEASEKILAERVNSTADIEAELRQMMQQLQLEGRKTQRLREDLVAEKTKMAELVGRLRSLCTAVTLNGGRVDKDVSDEELIEKIDNVLMENLAAARREADALRLQQHQQIAELTDLKKDIEKLRRSESASLVESDDRVQTLSNENLRIKEQVFLLQERSREQQIELAAKTAEVASARRTIEQLNQNAVKRQEANSEVARLQVSLRNLQLQEDLLKQDNAELRLQVDVGERAKQECKKAAESVSALHEALLADHDRLQKLHDLLSQDYERLKDENVEMKSKMRSSRPVISESEWEKMQTALSRERNAREESENSERKLRAENEALNAEVDCLASRYNELTSELRRLRLEDQNNKLNMNNAKATIDNLSKAVKTRDLQIVELKKEIEMLQELNSRLRAGSRDLLRRQELMLQDNKERDFQEKLRALHLHEERLEEEIMEGQRAVEKQKQKQPTFVKRTVKALIPKKSRSEPSKPGSTGSTTEESSAYSADEACSPPLPYSSSTNGIVALDDFHPTCSSSEDADRHSPPYAKMGSSSVAESEGSVLVRSSLGGGSLRVSAAASPLHRRLRALEEEKESGERLPWLPPRAPLRGSPASSSLRGRPPPPPYPSGRTAANSRPPPPPPYPGRTSTPVGTSSPIEFSPQITSTPKSEQSASPVAREGEKRLFVREKAERVQKALSIYENVSEPPTDSANQSTVWYEYGCV